MILFGLIWAGLAPLLLLLIAAAVARWLRRANIRWPWPLAIVALATPVASVWLWGCSGESATLAHTP